MRSAGRRVPPPGRGAPPSRGTSRQHCCAADGPAPAPGCGAPPPAAVRCAVPGRSETVMVSKPCARRRSLACAPWRMATLMASGGRRWRSGKSWASASNSVGGTLWLLCSPAGSWCGAMQSAGLAAPAAGAAAGAAARPAAAEDEWVELEGEARVLDCRRR